MPSYPIGDAQTSLSKVLIQIAEYGNGEEFLEPPPQEKKSGGKTLNSSLATQAGRIKDQL